MPVIQHMLGPWTELESHVCYLPASLISLFLLFTWFNRIPEAGVFWRLVWRYGRWLLISAYIWSLFVFFWLNLPVLLRSDHRNFEVAIVLVLIDVTVIVYLLLSKVVRRTFVEFPQPVDAKGVRESAAVTLRARKLLVQQARLAAPISQTREQLEIESHWRKEVEQRPGLAQPWVELGVMAYQNGRGAQALDLMDKAYQLEPNNSVVLRNLCELFRQQRQISRAVDFGQKAVAADPADIIARINLALALLDKKAPDLAIAQYHRIIEIDPQHVQSWLNLAVVLRQQGRKADAQAALDAVMLIEPENKAAQDLRAQWLI